MRAVNRRGKSSFIPYNRSTCLGRPRIQKESTKSTKILSAHSFKKSPIRRTTSIYLLESRSASLAWRRASRSSRHGGVRPGAGWGGAATRKLAAASNWSARPCSRATSPPAVSPSPSGEGGAGGGRGGRAALLLITARRAQPAWTRSLLLQSIVSICGAFIIVF